MTTARGITPVGMEASGREIFEIDTELTRTAIKRASGPRLLRNGGHRGGRHGQSIPAPPQPHRIAIRALTAYSSSPAARSASL